MILLLATSAVLLLWMDGWTHSVPVTAVTVALALGVFLAFRNAPTQRELTDYERIELERQAAHRWMARNGARPEDEARDARPRLQVIEGGKALQDSDVQENGRVE